MTEKPVNFYHALRIDPDICVGCTHCVNKCPTGALRIRGGKAFLHPNWCVDCGECLKVCPAKAIYVAQNDFERIFDYKCRVALVPALFLGQFPETNSEEEIFSAIYELGFTHIFEVESTVDVIRRQMERDIAAAEEKPSISPYCPAIVRLIQIRFPDLVDNILTVKAPVEASAVLYREQLRKEGFADEEIGMFYVTPCAAKIAALKYEEDGKFIDGVMNMDFMYNKVSHILHNKSGEAMKCVGKQPPVLSRTEMGWCQTAGEADNFEGRCFAVDEIHNVINFLERMETTGEIENIDFLELRACDRGCVGGALTPSNRFLASERLHERIGNHPEETSLYDSVDPECIEMLSDNMHTERLSPMTKLLYAGDMIEVLRKMNRAKQLVKYLPGIDCGACGSPGCESLAEDIVRGEAAFSNCVFMQREMIRKGKLSVDRGAEILDKVWGKNRLRLNINNANDNETE